METYMYKRLCTTHNIQPMIGLPLTSVGALSELVTYYLCKGQIRWLENDQHSHVNADVLLQQAILRVRRTEFSRMHIKRYHSPSLWRQCVDCIHHFLLSADSSSWSSLSRFRHTHAVRYQRRHIKLAADWDRIRFVFYGWFYFCLVRNSRRSSNV